MNRKTVSAIAAFLVALGTLLGTLVDSDETTTITIPAAAEVVVQENVAVDSTGDGEPDKVIELDDQAKDLVEEAVDAPEDLDLAGDLRGDDNTPVAEDAGPLATRNFPGCQTRILPTNWSNRTAAVRAIGLHYTAGGNLTGLSDMNGLTSYASSSTAGVSWHFLIDAEGHCYYSVPLENKAWTIGNLNSQTVNIEVIGRGNEPTYPAAPGGARKLRQVVRRLGQIYEIPMRVGAVSNCTVTRPGVITHWQGGTCSGGHNDIRPYDLAKVVRAIAASSCGKRCRTVKQLRAKHERTHTAFRKNRCRGKTAPRYGYCNKLRARNKRIHARARQLKASL